MISLLPSVMTTILCFRIEYMMECCIVYWFVSFIACYFCCFWYCRRRRRFFVSFLTSSSPSLFFPYPLPITHSPADSAVLLLFLVLLPSQVEFVSILSYKHNWHASNVCMYSYWYWNSHLSAAHSKTKLQQQNSLTQKIRWNKGFFSSVSIHSHSIALCLPLNVRMLFYWMLLRLLLNVCYVCPVMVLVWFLFEFLPSLDEGERVS